MIYKPQSDKTFSNLGQLQHPKTSSRALQAHQKLGRSLIIITGSFPPSLDCHSNEPVSRQPIAPDIFCDIFRIKNVLKNNKHADLDAEG